MKDSIKRLLISTAIIGAATAYVLSENNKNQIKIRRESLIEKCYRENLPWGPIDQEEMNVRELQNFLDEFGIKNEFRGTEEDLCYPIGPPGI